MMSDNYEMPQGLIGREQPRSAKRTGKLPSYGFGRIGREPQTAQRSAIIIDTGSPTRREFDEVVEFLDDDQTLLPHSGPSREPASAESTTSTPVVPRPRQRPSLATPRVNKVRGAAGSNHEQASQDSNNTMEQLQAEAQAEADIVNNKRDREDPDFVEPGPSKRPRRQHQRPNSGAASSPQSAGDQGQSTNTSTRAHKRKTFEESTPAKQAERSELIQSIVEDTDVPAINFVPTDIRPQGAARDWSLPLLRQLRKLARITKSKLDLAHRVQRSRVSERQTAGKDGPEITESDVRRAIANISDEDIVSNDPPRSPTFPPDLDLQAGGVPVPFDNAGICRSLSAVQTSGEKITGPLPSPRSPSSAARSRRAEQQPVISEPPDPHPAANVSPAEERETELRWFDEMSKLRNKYQEDEDRARARKLLCEKEMREWEAKQKGNSAGGLVYGVSAND